MDRYRYGTSGQFKVNHVNTKFNQYLPVDLLLILATSTAVASSRAHAA
eukprot:SAG31_NODE_3172_length_4590_cov_2.002672_4_plen_48_part_00